LKRRRNRHVVDKAPTRSGALPEANPSAYVGSSTGIGTPIAILSIPLWVALADLTIGLGWRWWSARPLRALPPLCQSARRRISLGFHINRPETPIAGITTNRSTASNAAIDCRVGE